DSPDTTESEEELPHHLPNAGRSEGIAQTKQLPETESEASDSEPCRTLLRPIDPLNDPLRPRHAFKPTADQQTKGPLILRPEGEVDTIAVPRCVAMYLRPYQEDGVRFFWERYKGGQGGILGRLYSDDTALVWKRI